jgi:hypothetical protein
VSDTTTAEPPRLRVGAVFNRAFALLSRDFVKFFLLALIAWLPVLIVSFIVGFRYAALGSAEFVGPPQSFEAAGFLVVLLAGASFILSQAVILYGALEQMRDHSFGIGESLMHGLARFFPVLGVYILMTLAIGIGLVLLIVPGMILGMMLFVSLPACIVEKQGPYRSLKRSAELTKGNRWRILGIAILLYLGNVIGGGIVKFALLAVAGVTVAALGGFLWSVIFGAAYAIVVAVVYHDLRAGREGIDIEAIARSFDT